MKHTLFTSRRKALSRGALSLLAAALIAGAACKSPTPPDPSPAPAPAASEAPLRVATLFFPTTWLVRQIGGPAVQSLALLPPDADAATWRPPPAVIAQLQAVDRVVLNGAEFEGGLTLVSLPDSRVVSTAAGFQAEWIRRPEAAAHRHGDGPAHSHGGVDGHTWLDPVLLVAQAAAVRDALAAARPQHKEQFERGFSEVERALKALDVRWKALAPRLRAAPLLANHPAYDYPARRYGFQVRSFDLDPEERPDPAQAAAVLAEARAAGARIMLWEAAPTAEVTAALAEAGLRHVVFSPAEQAPADASLPALLEANLRRLEEALGQGAPGQ